VLSLSPIKILIILVVILLVVGPDKLPQIARQIGEAWQSLRTLSRRIEDEVRSSVPDLPSAGDLARFARSPTALLDRLAGLGDEPLEPDPGAEGQTPGADDQLRPDPAAPQAGATEAPSPLARNVEPPNPGVDPTLN
jgi:TatA/E family protein of Tat protein translocase